jgi:hypothetical protein
MKGVDALALTTQSRQGKLDDPEMPPRSRETASFLMANAPRGQISHHA